MMRNLFLLGCFLFLFSTVHSQKVINNPDCISQNIGSITKVELTDKETVIHMHVRASVGSWVYIPKETYIEDFAGKSQRQYITKADGITLNKKVFYKVSDEKSFKLYFPPLDKNIKRINYGESNRWGNWFIYKLDLTKDGMSFIKTQHIIKNKKQKTVIEYSTNHIKATKNLTTNTIFPKDLPKDFFGNWYDKYGTLVLITTPDYIVSDNRIKYYFNIQEIGKNKFKIQTSSNTFEILNLDDEFMTIRTNKLITLKKKSGYKKVPQFLKGKWLHWEKIKEITITDDYFYNEDKDYHGTYRDPVKNKIDYVAESNNGELIWFVLYNKGNYNIYFVKKINNEYILQPRGFVGARYTKVEN